MPETPVIRLCTHTPTVLTVEEFDEVLQFLKTTNMMVKVGIERENVATKVLASLMLDNMSRYHECKQILEGIRLDEEHDC